MHMYRIFLFPFFICISVAHVNSQNVENSDSINIKKNTSHSVDSIKIPNSLFSDTCSLVNNVSLEILKSELIDSLSITRSNIEKSILFPFTPYSYSFNSLYEGITIKGIYRSFSLTDFLAANINLYLSRAYFENILPYPYINGSINGELKLKLNDRVQLVGVAQISIREGPDPKLPSLTGGANYYGGGLQFKIINNIGIGVGLINNYYRGDWTRRTYIVPVQY